MSDDISMRRLKDYVKKLKIVENSVILIRRESALGKIEMWKNALAQMNFKNIIIVLVDDFEEVQAWDKAFMQKHGWYRLEDMRKLFEPDKKEKKEDENKNNG